MDNVFEHLSNFQKNFLIPKWAFLDKPPSGKTYL